MSMAMTDKELKLYREYGRKHGELLVSSVEGAEPGVYLVHDLRLFQSVMEQAKQDNGTIFRRDIGKSTFEDDTDSL